MGINQAKLGIDIGFSQICWFHPWKIGIEPTTCWKHWHTKQRPWGSYGDKTRDVSGISSDRMIINKVGSWFGALGRAIDFNCNHTRAHGNPWFSRWKNNLWIVGFHSQLLLMWVVLVGSCTHWFIHFMKGNHGIWNGSRFRIQRFHRAHTMSWNGNGSKAIKKTCELGFILPKYGIL